MRAQYEFFDVDDIQAVRDSILKQAKAAAKAGSVFLGVNDEHASRDVDWTLFLNGAELVGTVGGLRLGKIGDDLFAGVVQQGGRHNSRRRQDAVRVPGWAWIV